MIGVVKQKEKATGELKEYTIQMGKAFTPAAEELPEQDHKGYI